jgi:hypothetical protein
MMSNNPLRVVVELLAGQSLGTLMNEMREWLDSQKIQTVDFRPARQRLAGIEIAFRNVEEAEQFRERFNPA